MVTTIQRCLFYFQGMGRGRLYFFFLIVIIPPLPEGGGGYSVLPLSVLPSVQDIFRRIFLSNCWWQKSDIWSQASYRYTILWVTFLDPSDSYFLFDGRNLIFLLLFSHLIYDGEIKKNILQNKYKKYKWHESSFWHSDSNLHK